jgi:hypothetical protein
MGDWGIGGLEDWDIGVMRGATNIKNLPEGRRPLTFPGLNSIV